MSTGEKNKKMSRLVGFWQKQEESSLQQDNRTRIPSGNSDVKLVLPVQLHGMLCSCSWKERQEKHQGETCCRAVRPPAAAAGVRFRELTSQSQSAPTSPRLATLPIQQRWGAPAGGPGAGSGEKGAGGGGGLAPPSLGAMAARSGSGAKEMILLWVQNRLRDYPIPMTNFSTCWNDGLAFCALVHVFYPEAFDWYSLCADNRRHNFTLAFQKAEELAGIYPLLEVDDMVKYKKPDWKCVFTYVQSFYRRFRDGRSPPPILGAKQQQQQVGAAPVVSAVALAVAEEEQKGRLVAACQPIETPARPANNKCPSIPGGQSLPETTDWPHRPAKSSAAHLQRMKTIETSSPSRQVVPVSIKPAEMDTTLANKEEHANKDHSKNV